MVELVRTYADFPLGAVDASVMAVTERYHGSDIATLDRLPDETWFYPGHGTDSTLDTERPALPALHARGW